MVYLEYSWACSLVDVNVKGPGVFVTLSWGLAQWRRYSVSATANNSVLFLSSLHLHFFTVVLSIENFQFSFFWILIHLHTFLVTNQFPQSFSWFSMIRNGSDHKTWLHKSMIFVVIWWKLTSLGWRACKAINVISRVSYKLKLNVYKTKNQV